MNWTYISPVTRSQQSTCHFLLAATDLCRILFQGFRGLSNLHEQLMSSAWQESSLDIWDNPPKDIIFFLHNFH